MAATQAGNSAGAVEMSGLHGGIKLELDQDGAYKISCMAQGWQFAGKLPSACQSRVQSQNADSIGRWRQINFNWQDGQLPMAGSIRLYDDKPLVLFSDTSGAPDKVPPSPFPDFKDLPRALHVFSYQDMRFAPPSFKANDCATPWLLFDDKANALVISPASHFMVASMIGDGHGRVASGFETNLCNVPEGFSQQTILAFGNGINRTWDLWGRSLNALRGAQRPGNEADDVLKYVGYWTDHGAAYYYNYDPALGYAGTLQSLVARYRREQIPIRYLQLDSWWYYKTFTGPDGKACGMGNPRLPEGAWNRGGGLLEYKAHPFLFTNGLAAFQKAVGLPLVTHNRWIDPASPYHEQYKISGLAAVDPKWWDNIAGYMKASGIVTYEQDWLDFIYNRSPEFSSTADVGEAFLNEMARACREQGITMQYCMPLPCYYLQGSSYENLTTIRVSDDRFIPARWNDFLYTSRLAGSLGIWPWSDVFMSGETNNLLLATLSAGAVGIGDAIGKENRGNLLKSVRADGVIVKPDAPCVPLDRCYVADARHSDKPLVAGTYTDHNGLRTSYVFVFNRDPSLARTARFSPAELGLKGEVYVYDGFSGKAARLKAKEIFTVSLPPKGTGFYEVAPVGRSGIAFLGDSGKFVSTGKQRISRLQDEPDSLTAEVVLAASEPSVELHGFAGQIPAVAVRNGTAAAVKFDPATHHFSVEILADPSSPAEGADPVRHIAVRFTSAR
jgi:hypothetical protein